MKFISVSNKDTFTKAEMANLNFNKVTVQVIQNFWIFWNIQKYINEYEYFLNFFTIFAEIIEHT